MYLEQKDIVGCVPSTPEQLAELRECAAPWDSEDKPPVSIYAQFRKYAEKMPDAPCWIHHPNAGDFFTKNQGTLGSCSGFAMTGAATARTLTQCLQYSEQLPTKFNPFVPWCKSKDYSTRGGQTLAAIAKAGNDYGNYPVDIVGPYSDREQWNASWNSEEITKIAATYQIGIAEIGLEGDDLVDETFFLCRKGFPVFFGATACISSSYKSKDGYNDGKVERCGGHAQACTGYLPDIDAVVFQQSWGDIFDEVGNHGVPTFCVPVRRDTLRELFRYAWDAYVVTYAECPYDTALEPTLEV